MKSDELLDMIGEVEDSYIAEAKKAGRTKGKFRQKAMLASALAACLMITVSGLWIFQDLGGKSGNGAGEEPLVYMHYAGPVLPLAMRGDADGISACREITFDFSPYTGQGDDRWKSEAEVTDRYVLTNTGGRDRTETFFYPRPGSLQDTKYYPKLTVNGKPVEVQLYPGPYSGGFRGVSGTENTGRWNLKDMSSFADYESLLSTQDYLEACFDAFPSLDIPVTVYRLHDFQYSADREAVNPTLNIAFFLDDSRTRIFTLGFNGMSYSDKSGRRTCHMGRILYNPQVEPEYQEPDDGYLLVLGEDISDYTLTGYRDGSCKPGTELDDLSCTVTRSESTLQDIFPVLLREYMERGDRFAEFLDSPEIKPSDELICGLAAELLYDYGSLGNFPAERYMDGMLEDIFSEVLNQDRITCSAFSLTIPAGESVVVEAVMLQDGSCDYTGKNQGKDGYDLAAQLGSNLQFDSQRAQIAGWENIEIIGQNFGFDLKKGISGVTLDSAESHYWMEIIRVE